MHSQNRKLGWMNDKDKREERRETADSGRIQGEEVHAVHRSISTKSQHFLFFFFSLKPPLGTFPNKNSKKKHGMSWMKGRARMVLHPY